MPLKKAFGSSVSDRTAFGHWLVTTCLQSALQSAWLTLTYHVEKDIPQGKVYIGLRGIKRDDPDYFPMLVMNDILGGGGFTSRIMQSVRSNEGLAYSAGSRLDANPYYPGEVRALFQSKNPTVALAIKLIDDEFNRIRSEPVTAQELETAKNSFVETFPQNFASKEAMLGIFVDDEWTKRPEGYWKTFRDKVMAVQPTDVQRVATKYLDPKNMAIMVVGNWSQIYEGNDRASMKDFFNGDVTHIPAKDPVTLEPQK
jgi:zinc protease